MKWHGVSIKDSTDFQFTKPQVYTSSTWKSGNWFVYTGGTWKMIGAAGTQMIPFVVKTDQPFTANGNEFLVRQLLAAKLKDSSGNYLKDSNGAILFSDYRGT